MQFELHLNFGVSSWLPGKLGSCGQAWGFGFKNGMSSGVGFAIGRDGRLRLPRALWNV